MFGEISRDISAAICMRPSAPSMQPEEEHSFPWPMSYTAVVPWWEYVRQMVKRFCPAGLRCQEPVPVDVRVMVEHVRIIERERFASSS